MAVVQISRIQVRRGRSLSGTGLPQLASGELAWSLDTQELYIGNGAVSEGAPAVGNTKILTERDLTVQGNLLNLIQHIYKTNDPAIQTGATPNSPISRTVQDRLDDRVSVADFGAVGDGTTDDTAAIQRAINQLFLNAVKASAYPAGVADRVTLDFAPGIYKITGTLYIPSFATLVGAGPDKTFISYTGTASAIQFVNDTSTAGNPSTISGTLFNTQPRNICIDGLTVITNTSNQIALQLDAVRDSEFRNIVVKGLWNNTYNANSKGIAMNAVSALVTCANNSFDNIVVAGFSYAVWAKQDIINNTFRHCYVTDVRQGFVLGEGADGTTVGQQYGPRETQITNSKFEDVKQHAVFVGRGAGNTTRDNKLVNVGNNGAGVFFPTYPQIYFGSVGNTSENDQSDRSTELSNLSFTADLTLTRPITASRNSLIEQTQGGTTIRAYLKDAAVADSTVTVVTKYLTPFNLTNNISVNSIATPGDEISVVVTGSDTVKYTCDSTTEMVIGTAVKFTGTMGGVVAGTTYYVQNIQDNTHFSIADSLGGAQRVLSPSSGTMLVSFNPIVKAGVVGSSVLVPYIPEVAGFGTYKSYGTKQVNIGYSTSPSLAFTLPISTSEVGAPIRSVSYKINYMYRSNSNNFTREGTITLMVDVAGSDTANSTIAQLSDEYNVAGITDQDALLLDFSAVLLNQTGAVFSGPTDSPQSIAIRYTNLYAPGNNSDSGVLSYTYTAIL